MKQHQPSDRLEKIPLTLGDLLKSRREAAGLNLTEMAAKLGISRPYLTRLEGGEHKRPSPTLLASVIKNLDVRPEDLYAITGYIPSTELPSLRAYLRATHPEWPEHFITEIDDFCDFIASKHDLR
jgi:transcriptional regulator with XRE-family HTH domain